MKKYKLVVLSIFVFAVMSSSLATREVSIVEPAEAASLLPATQAECARYWACEPCSLLGRPGNRNIFVEECPDGSIQVLLRRACGEDCF